MNTCAWKVEEAGKLVGRQLFFLLKRQAELSLHGVVCAEAGVLSVCSRKCVYGNCYQRQFCGKGCLQTNSKVHSSFIREGSNSVSVHVT